MFIESAARLILLTVEGGEFAIRRSQLSVDHIETFGVVVSVEFDADLQSRLGIRVRN
jgi:hypothetical protein